MSYGHHHNRFSPDFAEHEVKLSPEFQLQQIPPNLIPENFWIGVDGRWVVLGKGNDRGEPIQVLSEGLVMPDEPVEAVVAEAIYACWLWQEANLTAIVPREWTECLDEDFWTEETV